MLTDPARFGADPDDAFTVVAPSLPGGSHFAAQGGDWGALAHEIRELFRPLRPRP